MEDTPRKEKAFDEASPANEKKQPPITMGEATAENPSGIEAVSEDHARWLGQQRGLGGPGAAGATVAGGAIHVATEGGTKPLPVAPHNHPAPSAGAEVDIDEQPTSQAAAAESGDANTHADNPNPTGISLLQPTM